MSLNSDGTSLATSSLSLVSACLLNEFAGLLSRASSSLSETSSSLSEVSSGLSSTSATTSTATDADLNSTSATTLSEALSQSALAGESSAPDLVLSSVVDNLSSHAGSLSLQDSESGANLSWSTELSAAADLLSVDNDLLGAGWLRSNQLSADANTSSSLDLPSLAESDWVDLDGANASSDGSSSKADELESSALGGSVGVVVRNALEWLGSVSPNCLSSDALTSDDNSPAALSSSDE